MSHTLLQHCYLQQFILVSRNVRPITYSHVQNLDVTGRANTGNTSKVPAYFSLISRGRQAFQLTEYLLQGGLCFFILHLYLSHYT